MIGVGTTGETALKPGVHLRWAFQTQLGFPPYGFALFRKPSITTTPICFDSILAGRTPSANAGYRITNQGVTIRSNLPLRLTDQVPAGGDGRVEVDLSGRRYLKVAFSVPQKRVTLKIFTRSATTINARATWRGGLVDSRSASVPQGRIIDVALRFDSIDEVTIDGADALLVDACGEPLFPDGYTGWLQVPGFRYPLALPVTHPNYPATGPAPENPAAFATEARRRVQAPAAPPLSQETLDEAYTDLIDLVVAGPPQNERLRKIIGTPDTVDLELQDNTPEITVYPLQNVLLAALRPEMAQVVGLYWLDATVKAGEKWDYLVLGFWSDPLKAFGAGWKWQLSNQLVEGLPNGVYGYIVTELSLQIPAPTASPQDVRAYYLPGLTSRRSDGVLRNWQNNVGLRWRRDLIDGHLLPSNPIFHHVYRAALGQGSAPQDPLRANYGKAITDGDPVLVTRPPATLVPQRPPHWPDFPLHYIDRGLADGWYGYRLQAIDIFGRQSVLSDPADWHDYNPPGLRRQDAIQVIDRMPPPQPNSVTVQALQSGDPYLPQADLDWLAAHFTTAELQQGAAGLRIRWEWPDNLKRQAPDMAPGGAFRLYFKTGSLNAENGTIESVTDRGATSEVVWLQGDARPAGYYVGARLQSRNDLFHVAASAANVAGQPVTLTVDNLTPEVSELKKTPTAGGASVIFPAGHPQHRDYSSPATPGIWETRFHTAAYNPGANQYEIRVRVADMNVPRFAVSEQAPVVYGAVGVTAVDTKGNESAVAGPGVVALLHRRPPDPPTLPPDSERVWATRPEYHGHSHYTFHWNGQRHLSYLVCRALDSSLFRHDFLDSKGNFTYQQRRNQYNDDPLNHADFAGAWPDEFNDVVPPNDFSRRQIVTDELNALWDTLDPIRAQLEPPNNLSPAARALLVESALALYRRLSNDALRVLASLPDNTPVFTRLTPQPLNHRNLSQQPNSPGVYAYTDRLEGRGRNRYFYRARSVDAAHNTGPMGLSSPPIYLPDEAAPAPVRLAKVLGGDIQAKLSWSSHPPGTAERYRIYRTDSKENAADLRLMGEPVAEALAQPLTVMGGAVDFGSGIDVATVVGIYAAAIFDPLQDPLSQPGPNLLAAPRVPINGRITGLNAADAAEVVAVYRDSRGGLQVTPYKNGPRRWNDAGLIGGRTYFYRLVAVRNGEGPAGMVEIVSRPSGIGAARIADTTPPDPPLITTLEWVRIDADGRVYPYADPIPAEQTRYAAVRLAWTAPNPPLNCLAQVQTAPDDSFTNASGWLGYGASEFVHRSNLTFFDLTYRLKVVNQIGLTNDTFATVTLTPP